MAAATKTVTIRFTGDTSGLGKAAANGHKSIEGFGAKVAGTMKRIATITAGVLGADLFRGAVQGVQDFVGGSVQAFSGLSESLNAVDKVFGTSAAEIKQWGEQNANALGLSTRAFNELATPLGAMLKNAGLSLADTTGWTEKLTERAADMASVFNVDVSEALTAIQAGLRGESDPLERFGVGLSAAKVEAAALAATGKKAAKDLTDQEKATARLNLIMAQTASTAGDFRSTSDGLANSQRIAAAKTEELQAKIGQKLAPVVQKVTELKLKLVGVVADKILPAFDRFSKSPLADWIKTKLVPAVADFGRWLVTVGEKVVQFGKWLNEHRDVLLAVAIGIAAVLVPAFVAWAISAGAAAIATIAAVAPILLIVAAVALLAFGIIQLVKHWDTIWGHIWGFMKMIGAWFAGPFAGFFVGLWKGIVGGVVNAKNSIVNTFNNIVGWFRELPGRIGSAIGSVASTMTAPFRSAFSAIARLWNNTVGKLRFTVPDWVPGIGGKGFSMPKLPTFHSGGIVPGPLGRPTPILALGGERVLTREQQQSMGPEVLELHLDLGQGIQQVVSINLREHDRRMRRRALAGAS